MEELTPLYLICAKAVLELFPSYLEPPYNLEPAHITNVRKQVRPFCEQKYISLLFKSIFDLQKLHPPAIFAVCEIYANFLMKCS